MNRPRPRLLWLAPLALAIGCGTSPPHPVRGGDDRNTIRFTDVAVPAGLDYRWGNGGKHPLNVAEIMGAGGAFIDFNRDGWLDIVLAGRPGVALYRNEMGSRFHNATAGLGLESLKAVWYGCATGDYDADGYADLYLTGYGRSALLRNEAGQRFRDVTTVAGVGLSTWTSSAGFADVDGDGRLDLYVGAYVRFRPGDVEFTTNTRVPLSLGPDAYPAQRGVLFMNQGDGRFRDRTAAAGLLSTHGKCLGVAFADQDDDGDDDLYLANDQMPGDLFENDGQGRFRNIGVASGTALDGSGDRQGGMGVAWGDYDNDGRLDLFVATFAQEPKSLYHNDGGSLFSERSYAAGISQTTYPDVSFGTCWADFDSDGLLDLMLANGHVQDLIHQADPTIDYPQRTQLFKNRGDGTFVAQPGRAGDAIRRPIVGRALAVGDYNNDGAPDALVVDLEGAPMLLRNNTRPPGSHWLTLDVRGRHGEVAIGARVELSALGRRQMREVRTDGSYLAASDPRVHFGLGPAGRVDSLRVRWPSGGWQSIAPPPVDQTAVVKQR